MTCQSVIDTFERRKLSRAINQQNFHEVHPTGSAFLTNALLLGLNNTIHTRGQMKCTLDRCSNNELPSCRCLSIHFVLPRDLKRRYTADL